MILQAQNPQTPKELYPLTPKFELDQETIRREIIENLIRFADFIGHPKAKKMSDTRVAMKTKVIVIVSGGCIRDIQTNDPTLDAIVVDYDCNEETPNTRIVDDNLADVWPVTLSPITLDV